MIQMYIMTLWTLNIEHFTETKGLGNRRAGIKLKQFVTYHSLQYYSTVQYTDGTVTLPNYSPPEIRKNRPDNCHSSLQRNENSLNPTAFYSLQCNYPCNLIKWRPVLWLGVWWTTLSGRGGLHISRCTFIYIYLPFVMQLPVEKEYILPG